MTIHSSFPKYEEFNPTVPVWCVTPGEGRTIHRFFDTPPFSPSNRYMALFRLPFEDRLPSPGDRGEIVVVDLQEGTEKIVADTAGWEPQMGANVQWGGDDATVLFNDVDQDTWKPILVQLNHQTGERTTFPGGMYHASPNGRYVLASDLTAMCRTQYGYGVIIPEDLVPRYPGFSNDTGIYITDLVTGERRLLVSIKKVMTESTPTEDPKIYEGGECYGFHCKWSPSGRRIVFTTRWIPPDTDREFDNIRRKLRFNVFVMDADGGNIRLTIPSKLWEHGGHHTNWVPDETKLSMNLGNHSEKLRLMWVNIDGSGLEEINPVWSGSGHPTVHPNGRNILTDTYANEPMVFGDGTTPLRWLTIRTGEDRTLVRFPSETPHQKEIGTLRVDPHPAWDRSRQYVAFNAFLDGTRRVMVADMRSLL